MFQNCCHQLDLETSSNTYIWWEKHYYRYNIAFSFPFCFFSYFFISNWFHLQFWAVCCCFTASGSRVWGVLMFFLCLSGVSWGASGSSHLPKHACRCIACSKFSHVWMCVCVCCPVKDWYPIQGCISALCTLANVTYNACYDILILQVFLSHFHNEYENNELN